MKMVKIEGENLHIFWTSWISMTFSGKMLTYDNIKSHKYQSFTLSLGKIKTSLNNLQQFKYKNDTNNILKRC